MNVTAIELDDNIYAISDQNGNMRVITNNGDSGLVEKILMTENDIENWHLKIDECHKRLRVFLFNNICDMILAFLPILGGLVLYIFSRDLNYLITSALIGTTFHLVFLKGVIRRMKKISNLKLKISNIQENISLLERKLDKMKAETKYDELELSKVEKDNLHCYSYVFKATDDLNQCKTNVNVDNKANKGYRRILKLTDKRDN